MRNILLVCLLVSSALEVAGQVFNPNDGDSYKNPILYEDYSDPDVVGVDGDYYMVASSFNCSPGLPVLHSTDLVNWKIVNYVLDAIPPRDHFALPRHGDGVWAPSIRYHKEWYYVYYGDPDFGIFMVKTRDPRGNWEEPVLVKEARGWIDPCPLWDDDGKAYLVHAFAGSRAGVKSVLLVHAMHPDGTHLLDNGVMVIDGHEGHSTIEGPKFYKKDGYYYIFAPSGGVSTGWQDVLRSRAPFGPYEVRTVLEQGDTEINGPHQGAWVTTPAGEDWFYHFQDVGPYGRIVHLQPMQWQDGWPVIGEDRDGDGTGTPVAKWKKPAQIPATPQYREDHTDEFNTHILNPAWQWHANPSTEWGYPSGSLGYLRLNGILADSTTNLWGQPNLLLQKFSGPAFSATSKLRFHPQMGGDRAGLIVMGRDYAYLGLTWKDDSTTWLQYIVCKDAEHGGAEAMLKEIKVNASEMYLRVNVNKEAKCVFEYSTDGEKFTPVGAAFQAREGKWIGAKVGLFCTSIRKTNDRGYLDVDWFRMTPFP